jgi:hypothetical protein
MNTATPSRIIDRTAMKQILNSRQSVTRADVGKQVTAFIQGSGTFQSATEQEAADKAAGRPAAKQYFDKYIYNLKANSQEAVTRQENKKLCALAWAEESEGNMEAASEINNRYLNAVQISFNVIARAGVKKLEDGDQVTAVIEEAITKDGNTALVVNQVKYKAPATLAKIAYAETDLVDDFTVEELAELKARMIADKKLKAA